jgi:crotonobetainyl-CoA:carnitine CoA-transferase CaiB-like acyl-CoA transferase
MTRLAGGGDFIFSIVNAVDDLAEDPQVLANGYVTTFPHPTFGPTQVVGVPVRLSETPGSLRHPAPEFGQHTEEVLTDVLGYSWDDVARLRAADAI